jgi:putative ABC transport system permease protein
MPLLARVSSLVGNLFRRRRVERELDDELRAYVEMLSDEKQRAGLDAGEARRAALVEIGGVEQIKEQVRDARAGALVEQLWQDLSYAVRLLLKHRGFTAAALATLTFGLGINTAVFTIVDTVVFRPLPYEDPSRLVKICGNSSARPIDDVSLPDFRDIRERNRVFSHVAADNGMGFTIEYQGVREPVNGGLVTPDWLSTLGVQPVFGRGFLAEENQPGRDRVVILTDAFWRRRFGADPAAVGRSMTVDGQPFTIVGVLPPNILRYGADFLKPLIEANEPADRGRGDLDVIARLRPGITLADAQAEIASLGRHLLSEYPTANEARGFSVIPLDKYYAAVEPKATRGLLLILGAVAVLLLIACVNVANLLLARSIGRARECVVRAALGATRGRLVRQLLVENMLLFALGGVLGTLLAGWIVTSLLKLAVAEGYVPGRMAIAVDARVVAFGLLMSIVAGIAFGLAIALRVSRVDPSKGLKDSASTVGGGLRRSRARRALIVSELTLSLVLLVGFSLVTRSLLRIQANPGGFVPHNVVEIGSDGGRDFGPAVAFWRSALARARELPGVELAAVSSRPPVHPGRQLGFAIEGPAGAPREFTARGGDILISADYFRTLGIPVLQGRPFTEQDGAGAPPVVIVSDTLARRYFGGASPIGRRISLDERSPSTCCAAAGPVENVWREIVGVVGDIRQGNIDEAPAATIYRPYTQIVEHDMLLMVRARSPVDAARLLGSLASDLAAENPGSEWWDPRSMEQVIARSESVRLRRFMLTLLGSFAGMALVLAAVGLYGVVAYSLTERRREIGIRVALGATRSAILKQVLTESLRLAVISLLIGGIAAYFLARFISSLLFDIYPGDVPTYVLVSLVLTAVTLAASYLPARRASRVDPILALRES